MPSFDLSLLGALDALLTECNVTRAAERLHVTQPTMSGMLQRLRAQFDDQILVRNGRAMELTPLGVSLVEPVREALTRVDALSRVEATFDPATSRRTFSIMTSDYCIMVFMPHVVSRLVTMAPGIRLEFHSLNAPIEKLVSGEVDICISVHDRSLLAANHPDVFLESATLFSDEFVCIVAEDHPLDESATLADHLRYPHVGVKVGGTIDSIDTVSMRGLEPLYKPAFVVEDFWLVPGLVEHSTLVGVVQRRLARIAARTYAIRSYPPPYLRPPINETMHWHPRCSTDPAHNWLRGMIASEASRWIAEE
jgi:LysR family nod box-dependent transcriptional activator